MYFYTLLQNEPGVDLVVVPVYQYAMANGKIFSALMCVSLPLF